MSEGVFVLTGGGSGGHITPLLAVAAELKQSNPGIRTIYIGQRGDSLHDIASGHASIDEICLVSAGKFRRYHGTGLRQVFDIKTILLNVRDMVRVVRGFFESYTLLRKLRPQVVFIKGGFVGVPVGLASALLRIPYITHDSDALPGLANRIVARWAVAHAVALPTEIYTQYPADKTFTVGVPIARTYQFVDTVTQDSFRRRIGFDDYEQVVTVAGGGLGARRVNDAIVAIAPLLLARYPALGLIHQAGRANEVVLGKEYDRILTSEQRKRVHVKGFVTNMYEYTAAADVVIARAGGTNLAELEAQGKACIVIPNPYLTGGHQLVNAAVLHDVKAIELVREEDIRETPSALLDVTTRLLDDATYRQELSINLHTFARTDSAAELADLLVNFAR